MYPALHTSTIRAGLLSVVLLAFFSVAVPGQTPLKSELVVQGLHRPVDVRAAPRDRNRIFIVEQHTGQVWVIKNGQLLPAPFLDVGSKIDSLGSVDGLLSLTFHPQYKRNGYLYVSYTRSGDSAMVVERYTVDGADADLADPSSATLIMDPTIPGFHRAGCLQFGPDGFLYLAMGDGGGCTAQSFGSKLGKIVRMEVDDGLALVRRRQTPPFWTFHMGLRNPWRFSFDRTTGDLYIGDVGEADREEISFHPAGMPGIVNFGWPMMEGSICGPLDCGNPPPCGDPALVLPIYEYSHGPSGRAVIGGYVYRGRSIPELQGTYFFGDNQGKIYSFRYTGGNVTEFNDRTNELGPISNLSAFGEDASGELYFAGLAGKVYKIVPDIP